MIMGNFVHVMANAGLRLVIRPLLPDWKNVTSELWYHPEYTRQGGGVSLYHHSHYSE